MKEQNVNKDSAQDNVLDIDKKNVHTNNSNRNLWHKDIFVKNESKMLTYFSNQEDVYLDRLTLYGQINEMDYKEFINFIKKIQNTIRSQNTYELTQKYISTSKVLYKVSGEEHILKYSMKSFCEYYFDLISYLDANNLEKFGQLLEIFPEFLYVRNRYNEDLFSLTLQNQNYLASRLLINKSAPIPLNSYVVATLLNSSTKYNDKPSMKVILNNYYTYMINTKKQSENYLYCIKHF